MEDTRLAVFKFLLLFLYVLLFISVVFSFIRGPSIISSLRYFFVEAYPFKNICQVNIFVLNCLSTESVLTEQVVRISL